VHVLQADGEMNAIHTRMRTRRHSLFPTVSGVGRETFRCSGTVGQSRQCAPSTTTHDSPLLGKRQIAHQHTLGKCCCRAASGAGDDVDISCSKDLSPTTQPDI
jgi:hypothetical protein